MALMVTLILSGVLLTLAPGFFTAEAIEGPYPITLTVYDSLSNQPNLTFTTCIAYRGILIGAMEKVQRTHNNFRFTTTYNEDYGPFLESINDVTGNLTQHTYWELLIQPKTGTIIVADVGIGCYIPDPHDNIIFKFTEW